MCELGPVGTESGRKEGGNGQLIHTLHRDFANVFFSCSETVPWIFLSLAALPDILRMAAGMGELRQVIHQIIVCWRHDVCP